MRNRRAMKFSVIRSEFRCRLRIFRPPATSLHPRCEASSGLGVLTPTGMHMVQLILHG